MIFPDDSVVKNLPANARDNVGSIPGLGSSSRRGKDNPLHFSYLENPMESLVVYSPWGHRVGHGLATEHTCTRS